MTSSIYKVLAIVCAVCFVGIAVVCAALGGCTTMMECGDMQVPMKCHWTFVAMEFVSVIGIVMALLGAFMKDAGGRIASCVAQLLVCAVCAVLPTSLAIGMCSKSGMHCHTTAYVTWGICAAAAIISIVMLVRAAGKTDEKPKMQL